MNKTANCIRMLKLLYDRKNVVSRKELSEYLGTNIRNISEYKLELENAGYTIESVPGAYGGYRLVINSLLPVPMIEDEEFKALHEARKYLRVHDDFPLSSSFENAMMALSCVLYQSDISKSEYLQSVTQSDNQKISTYIKQIDEAIRNNQEIIFSYKRARNDNFYEVKLQPYAYFYKDTRYYVNGYTIKTKTKSYRNYVISEERMKDLFVNTKRFSKDEDYKLSDYVGRSSVYKGEEINLVLKVNKDIAYYVKERVNGYNYSVEEYDDYVLVRTSFDNEFICDSYVLSLAGNVEVIEPIEVRERIKNKLIEMVSKYE